MEADPIRALEQRYQRPTVKNIPLPYLMRVDVLAEREEIEVPADEDRGIDAYIEVVIRIHYHFVSHYTVPYNDRSGDGRQNKAAANFKADVTMIADDRYRFDNTDPQYNLALGREGDFEFRPKNNNPTLPTIVFTGNYDDSAPLEFGREVGDGSWVSREHIFHEDELPKNFSIEHTMQCRVDIFAPNGETLLAQRPADRNDDMRYILFDVGFNVDVPKPNDPDDDGREKPIMVDFYGNPAKIDPDRGGNLLSFWVEPLDPRCAWDKDNHWFPSHSNSDQIQSLQDFKECFTDWEPDDAHNTAGLGSLMRHVLDDSTGARIISFNNKVKQEEKRLLQMDGFFPNHPVNDKRLDPYDTFQRGYVANQNLQNVGELAFLQLAPFFTIHLYDPQDGSDGDGYLPEQKSSIRVEDGNFRAWFYDDPASVSTVNQKPKKPAYFHPVLDFFTLDQPGEFVRGKINLATTYRYYETNGVVRTAPSLASVFNGMPVSFMANGPFKKDLSDANGKTLAVLLAEEQRKNRKGFDRLSDLAALYSTNVLGRVKIDDMLADRGVSQVGKWNRDALIANAADLFTLRGQTYTILMCADASKDLHSPPLGSTHAIAEIWRDSEPMRNASGNTMMDGDNKPMHEVRILNFRILE